MCTLMHFTKIRHEINLIRLTTGHIVLWSFSPYLYTYQLGTSCCGMLIFHETLVIMYISNNFNRPYVCDPLGSYILIVKSFTDLIRSYWSNLLIIN